MHQSAMGIHGQRSDGNDRAINIFFFGGLVLAGPYRIIKYTSCVRSCATGKGTAVLDAFLFGPEGNFSVPLVDVGLDDQHVEVGALSGIPLTPDVMEPGPKDENGRSVDPRRLWPSHMRRLTSRLYRKAGLWAYATSVHAVGNVVFSPGEA